MNHSRLVSIFACPTAISGRVHPVAIAPLECLHRKIRLTDATAGVSFRCPLRSNDRNRTQSCHFGLSAPGKSATLATKQNRIIVSDFSMMPKNCRTAIPRRERSRPPRPRHPPIAGLPPRSDRVRTARARLLVGYPPPAPCNQKCRRHIRAFVRWNIQGKMATVARICSVAQ